ncbi:hypothetical protein SMA90_28890, partial [Escherichia coli]
AAIIDRIQSAQAESPLEEAIKNQPAQSTPVAPRPAAPVRRATIIADDSDDAAPPPRMPAPPRPSVDKTKTSTGKTKPAFTLQGSRAWHNPQPFSQHQQQPQQRYAPQLSQGINTLPREQGAPDAGL